jgi:hypothetical protein
LRFEDPVPGPTRLRARDPGGSLLGQPFTFLDVGFGASVAVFIDLALLATLRYLQNQEKRLVAGTAAA